MILKDGFAMLSQGRSDSIAIFIVIVGNFCVVLGIAGAAAYIRKGPRLKLKAEAIGKEVDAGQEYVTDLPMEVLSLLKEGRNLVALNKLRQAQTLSFKDAAEKIDEVQLRLVLGQHIRTN